MIIKVGRIEVVEEVDLVVIVFQGENKGEYFQIQDAYEYDEQDVRLGINNYYIEIKDQMFGSYGGIDRIEKKKSSLRIYLNSIGKNKLDLEEIILEIGILSFKSIEIELIKIFKKYQIEIEGI